ncbi:unnamed protein product, partial [Effrenium voratum]
TYGCEWDRRGWLPWSQHSLNFLERAWCGESRMAVIMAVGGQEVMSAQQFAQWQEDQSASGDVLEELRREVARHRRMSNFRQLRVVSGSAVLDHLSSDAPDASSAPLAVLVRPLSEDAEGHRALCQAASQGDAAEVKRWLDAPLDPSFAGQDLCSPLHFAAEHGHDEVARLLLEANADRNKVARCLLQADAALDKTEDDRRTPLHFAAENGHDEVACCLLAAGADPDKTDTDSWTPLHFAAANGHTEVARCLLRYGATTGKADDLGRVPLHFAADDGHAEIVHCLLAAGADKDKASKFGLTPLHLAAEEGHLEVVRCLLKAGADKGKTNFRGHTPRHFASLNGHEEVVRCLEAFADVRAKRTREHSMPCAKRARQS